MSEGLHEFGIAIANMDGTYKTTRAKHVDG